MPSFTINKRTNRSKNNAVRVAFPKGTAAAGSTRVVSSVKKSTGASVLSRCAHASNFIMLSWNFVFRMSSLK